MMLEKIRESVIAGTWYPGNPQELTQEIQRYLSRVQDTPLGGRLKALIVPHAGYMYSGGVAAHAYKLLLQQSFDRVIVVAPSHRAFFQGASVYDLGGYRTPLGVVPLDHEIVGQLKKESDAIRYVPQADAQEHALEIQLPFLQVALGEFRLTPVIMGEQTLENCQQLAAAVSRVCQGKDVLLVASTDLSHFHPYEKAKQLDQVVVDRLKDFDPIALEAALRRGECEACGGGPMTAVLMAAREIGANKVRILQYANSGDVTGDKSRVVGYLSAAVIDNPGKVPRNAGANHHRVGVDLGLTDDDKVCLHSIARGAIQNRLRAGSQGEVPAPSAHLKEHRGAFVTLKIGGALRGCIGCITPRAPLHRIVGDMAVQAAFCDPRFQPLTLEELERIDLEISVLTLFQDIQSPEEIEVGRHGLFICRGPHSGLLLPQVATEHKWDRIAFLEWTCQKAGLPKDAWKEPETRIQVFSADVF